jgi:competence protein ComFB
MMEARIMPRNLMEELVDSRLDEYMRSEAVCQCERCRADVMALALNNLQPKYVVSVSGEVYSRYDAVKSQFQADVITTILCAIAVINKRPRHDGEQRSASSH